MQKKEKQDTVEVFIGSASSYYFFMSYTTTNSWYA